MMSSIITRYQNTISVILQIKTNEKLYLMASSPSEVHITLDPQMALYSEHYTTLTIVFSSFFDVASQQFSVNTTIWYHS